MSVLIENMSMPRNCVECPLQYGGWCYVTPPDIDERIAENMEKASKGRPLWCPLVEYETTYAAPAVHGYWKITKFKAQNCAENECSQCGVMYECGYDETIDFDFCPHCGAKMDESEDSNEDT